LAYQEKMGLEKEISKLRKKECHDLESMLKGAKDVFENDALGRLQLIGWLHDFGNFDKNLYEYQ
jgi:hypothetical protein